MDTTTCLSTGMAAVLGLILLTKFMLVSFDVSELGSLRLNHLA